MEQSTTQEPVAEPAPKPVNWYSGWRLLVTSAVTVIGAKLIGIVGLLFAVPLFLWLQQKRGAWVALAVAVCVGLAVAVLYSAFVMPLVSSHQDAKTPTAAFQFAPSTAKPGHPTGANPFLDPNYGRELLQKQ